VKTLREAKMPVIEKHQSEIPSAASFGVRLGSQLIDGMLIGLSQYPLWRFSIE
jgi:hypothetical protein